jgi:D-alanyl-D-alanine carboxypeptidase
VYNLPPEDKRPGKSAKNGEDEDRLPPSRSARNAASHKSAAANPRRGFYADEHPEIPLIRRASLQKNRAEMVPANEHNPEACDDKPAQESDTGIYPRITLKQRRVEMPPPDSSGATGSYAAFVAKQKRAEMLPFTGLEAPIEEQTDTAKQERVARRQRSPLSTDRIRPVSARRRMKDPISQTGFSFFPRRKKTWLLIGLLALLALALAPILSGLIRNTMTQQKNASYTTSQVSISRLQSVPSNPHELVIMPPQTDHPAPPVLATSAFLLDADNEHALYAQNPYLHLSMLSTTKLMTAALAVETGNLDQQITITSQMEADISLLSADSALFGVKQGETYTLRDLIYGLLFVSGNDAALVIADALAGNVQNFVAEMNQKAQELGLRDTHFVNPHGLLNPGQYSCARDLAVLGQYSLSIPALQQMSSSRVYHIAAGGKHGARVLINENQFLWWYPGVDGGKTGFDGVSDFVQVMSVTRNHHHLIGVVIHTNNWWTDMRDLMDYGFNDYTWASPRTAELSGQPIPYDNLWNYFASDTQNVSVPTANNGRYYVYSGYTISNPILSYFDQKGGLKTFGFPMKMPVPTGSTLMSQQFQHGAIQCNLSTNQCSTV